MPLNWKSYSFHARFRDILFEVKVTEKDIEARNLSNNTLQVTLNDKELVIEGYKKIKIESKIKTLHKDTQRIHRGPRRFEKNNSV